jgi:hypothetical protein
MEIVGNVLFTLVRISVCIAITPVVSLLIFLGTESNWSRSLRFEAYLEEKRLADEAHERRILGFKLKLGKISHLIDIYDDLDYALSRQNDKYYSTKISHIFTRTEYFLKMSPELYSTEDRTQIDDILSFLRTPKEMPYFNYQNKGYRIKSTEKKALC